MNRLRVLACLLLSFSFAHAQITEFKKGWTTELRLQSGVATNFEGNSPDMFTGGLLLTEHATVVPGKLKAGAVAGGIYYNKKLQGLFGPEVLFKIKDFNASEMGSVGNLHLSANWLFGTEHEQMVGGGVHVSLLNLLTIGLTAHRDYNLNSWWFQSVISIRISKVKKTAEPFNEGPPK